MQLNVLSIMMMAVCVGYLVIMLADQKWIIKPISLLFFVMALISGDGGFLLLFDGVDLKHLFTWDLIVAFLSIWVFLFYAYRFMYQLQTNRMYVILVLMFVSVFATSISLVNLGNYYG